MVESRRIVGGERRQCRLAVPTRQLDALAEELVVDVILVPEAQAEHQIHGTLERAREDVRSHRKGRAIAEQLGEGDARVR